MPSRILERNLLALSALNPELGLLMSRSEPAGDIVFLPSGQGDLVPARRSGEHDIPLHSLVDPVREGRRFGEHTGSSGYLIFLGVGGGFHIRPFLESGESSRLVLVETGASRLRSVLEHIDLSDLLLDSRMRLLLGPTPEEIQAFLAKDYLPALDGDLKTVPLRSAVELDRPYFSSLLEAIRGALDGIAADYSVQSRFGRRWFTNILANLPTAGQVSVMLPPARRAVIAAAGPSLETQAKEIPKLRRGGILIATDTALPALLAMGHVPEVVLSIDCQQISYHHFLQGIPARSLLVLDLASPPTLARLAGSVLFFSSHHPLAQYMRMAFRPFPALDTSGGNVAHAAVSLAEALGAEEVVLLGLDFSYPQGKCYSRGTYLYPYLRSREDRLRPLEGGMADLLFRTPRLVRQPCGGSSWRYIPELMIRYRERLERYLRRSSLTILRPAGLGVAMELPSRPEKKERKIMSVLSAGSGPVTDWRAFLQEYRERLSGLPDPKLPLSDYFRGLPEEQRACWITLLPSAAAFGARTSGVHGPKARMPEVRGGGWTPPHGLGPSAGPSVGRRTSPILPGASRQVRLGPAVNPAALLGEVRAWALNLIRLRLETGDR